MKSLRTLEGMADRLREIRAALRAALGNNYERIVAPWREAIEESGSAGGDDPLEAALQMVKAIERRYPTKAEQEKYVLPILAALVDLMEPLPVEIEIRIPADSNS